jgi:hypothetical protein
MIFIRRVLQKTLLLPILVKQVTVTTVKLLEEETRLVMPAVFDALRVDGHRIVLISAIGFDCFLGSATRFDCSRVFVPEIPYIRYEDRTEAYW